MNEDTQKYTYQDLMTNTLTHFVHTIKMLHGITDTRKLRVNTSYYSSKEQKYYLEVDFSKELDGTEKPLTYDTFENKN